MMIKQLMLVLLLTVSNFTQAADNNHSKNYPLVYQGKVEGMVCAFCVYNVSKKIGQLPEVNAKTVNVDLKSGVVNFRSNTSVSFKKLASVFSDSGFKLVKLDKVTKTSLAIPEYQIKPVFEFNLNSMDVKQYESIIESIGNIAAESLGKLVIKAPESVEIVILKPMIGGKQKIARVEYTVAKNIEIQLFLKLK